MKAIISLSLVIAIGAAAIIAALVIFEVVSVDTGMSYTIKSVAAIAVLGVASAMISLITGRHKSENK